ncbi:UDP-glucose/GDP-mannose dehydrogenase family protein [Ammoniphilus sp. YIM 78166]|uniref:UDP-glucose dehydrogenase family protein n=1 Tax=Ammoniphilus sp. YIM 78166 TaxID=1644106 RepID=UPI00106F5950|nr:nucleotide sugar dehydrogenase [Ammoniphilus sp. YIM 78166]
MKQRLGVLGGGYVGLAVAVGFAERGFPVVLVESSEARFQALTEGSFFSSEEDLVKAFEKVKEDGIIHITNRVEDIQEVVYLFVCVGTPEGKEGKTDLRPLWAAVEQSSPYLREDACFIIKSTVPVGTGDQVQAWFNEKGKAVQVLSYPEFLREGKTLEDFRQPSRIVMGGDPHHPRVKELRHLLAEFSLPLLLTSRRDAEMIKYAANAFLATKISFINQMAQLCEVLGSDIQTVAKGIGMDPRIGQAFLAAGIGYGGPCLPKDMASLMEQGRMQDLEMPLLAAVTRINDDQRQWVRSQLRKQWGELKGRFLAVWGVTFKGGSEDVRESQAVSVLEDLLGEGVHIQLYDPFGLEPLKRQWESRGVLESYAGQVQWAKNCWESLERTEGLVILTDWQEFKEVDLQRLKTELPSAFIVDGRNLFYPSMMDQLGFKYVSVGRKV